MTFYIFRRTEKKQLTACFMFPEEGYPRLPIILELKSKVMPDKLLNGLSKLCDEQCKSLTGQQQVTAGLFEGSF